MMMKVAQILYNGKNTCSNILFHPMSNYILKLIFNSSSHDGSDFEIDSVAFGTTKLSPNPEND